MPNTEDIFWSLLQAGLWNKAPRAIDKPLTSEQWRCIWNVAAKQTVLGVLFDGWTKWPEAYQPTDELRKKWTFFTLRTEQMHRLLNHSLADLVARLDKEGIQSMLLKGQGNAQMYCNPLRRQCGDIDLYVGRSNYKRVCHLVHEWGIVTDDESESIKHLHFEWNKVDIEIHQITASFPWPPYQKQFVKWSEEVLQQTNEGFVSPAETTKIRVATPTYNALFIFYHLLYHFITGGIGLRQLCDLACYLHAKVSEIDLEELKKRLHGLGIMKPWQTFGYILVNTIGLNEKEFPFYDSSLKKKAQKVLQRIESEGNFGFYTEHKRQRPQGYIAGKIYSFLNNGKRYPSLMFLFPQLTLSHTVFYLTEGVVHVFLDHALYRKNQEDKKNKKSQA